MIGREPGGWYDCMVTIAENRCRMVDIMKGEVVAGQGAFLLRERTSYRVKVEDMQNHRFGEIILTDDKDINDEIKRKIYVHFAPPGKSMPKIVT